MTSQWYLIDTKINKIKDIVEQDAEEKAKAEYFEFKELFNYVKEFIIKKKLMLYGGLALNELLPPSKKFYDAFTLPDFDAFSINAQKHAKQLADLLHKKGYNYVEVKSGIHPGTFKVYAEFKAVADFTQVTKDFFKYMNRKSKENNIKYQSDPNLIIVPPVFLKWSLHKELARPEGSIHRWEKLFSRYVAFMSEYEEKTNYTLKDIKTFPPEFIKYYKKYKTHAQYNTYNKTYERTGEDQNETSHLLEIIQQLMTFIKTRNYPLIGNFALGLHLGMNANLMECCKADNYTSAFEIISIDIEQSYKDIKENIELPQGYKFVAFKSNTEDHFLHLGEILPPRMVVFLTAPSGKDYRLFSLLDTAGNCYSVCDIEGFRVGTVDTLLTFFYGFYIIYDYYFRKKDFKQTHLYISQTYISMLEKYANTKITTEERFATACYGNEKTLVEIKKERWNIRPFLYRPAAIQ